MKFHNKGNEHDHGLLCISNVANMSFWYWIFCWQSITNVVSILDVTLWDAQIHCHR